MRFSALAGLPPVKKSMSLNAAWRVGAACELGYRVLGSLANRR